MWRESELTGRESTCHKNKKAFRLNQNLRPIWNIKTCTMEQCGIEGNPNAPEKEVAIKCRLVGCSSAHEALAGISVKFKFTFVLVIASLELIKHSLASDLKLGKPKCMIQVAINLRM